MRAGDRGLGACDRVNLIDKTLIKPLNATAKKTKSKDTHRENTLSNKTPALRKSKNSTNMSVWAVGTLNQLFIRGS